MWFAHLGSIYKAPSGSRMSRPLQKWKLLTQETWAEELHTILFWAFSMFIFCFLLKGTSFKLKPIYSFLTPCLFLSALISHLSASFLVDQFWNAKVCGLVLAMQDFQCWNLGYQKSLNIDSSPVKAKLQAHFRSKVNKNMQVFLLCFFWFFIRNSMCKFLGLRRGHLRFIITLIFAVKGQFHSLL